MNAAQFFDHWNNVWRDLMRALAMLREQDVDFRPAPKYQRTLGDILRHIINLEQGWIHFVVRRELKSWPDEQGQGRQSLTEIRAELERTHKHTMDYLATIPVDDFNRIVQVPQDGSPKLGWILWHVLEQEIHHRGELYLCLSLLGMERPKTDRPG